APAPPCGRARIRKVFHQIDQNLAIPNTSNAEFPVPDQHVMSFSRATKSQHCARAREIVFSDEIGVWIKTNGRGGP
ncbi:MAG: hypothetical protein Q8R44_09170, partial [Novosphingobium sp.]|nr:hypothetical protein [Novosphingobium sp.]